MTEEALRVLKRLDAVQNGAKVLDVLSPDGSATGAIPFRELRRNYRQLCRAVHPDKWNGDYNRLATLCMQKVSRAFEIAEEYAEVMATVETTNIGECVVGRDCIFTSVVDDDGDADNRSRSPQQRSRGGRGTPQEREEHNPRQGREHNSRWQEGERSTPHYDEFDDIFEAFVEPEPDLFAFGEPVDVTDSDNDQHGFDSDVEFVSETGPAFEGGAHDGTAGRGFGCSREEMPGKDGVVPDLDAQQQQEEREAMSGDAVRNGDGDATNGDSVHDTRADSDNAQVDEDARCSNIDDGTVPEPDPGGDVQGDTACRRGDEEWDGMDTGGEQCYVSSAVGDDESDEVRDDPRKKMNRQRANRRYKTRVLQDARDALQLEREAAVSWKPTRAVQLKPSVGLLFGVRWRCDQYCRAYAAYLGVHLGVTVHQTTQLVESKCKQKDCKSILRFTRQVQSGNWKLVKYVGHKDSCFGDSVADENSGRKRCAPAYTAVQIARLLVFDGTQNGILSVAEISEYVKAKGIYNRHPDLRHFRAVKKVMVNMLRQTRAEDMAGLEGFARLLRSKGHTVEIYTHTAVEMKSIRMKAARYIFDQGKKNGTVQKEERFDPNIVDVSDIEDDHTYYGGFLFIPSIAVHMCRTARMTAAADASHCQGVGPQSYGTTFEVILYDGNHHIVPILFAHAVGTESEETWSRVFRSLANVSGFDVDGRVTIVDQEKSIDKCHRDAMQNANIFLDALHVKKNMSPRLGSERASGLSLYERALRAPCKDVVDIMKAQYGEKQRAYLGRFADKELYRAYSKLQDLITTSQGAESQMSSSLRNHIRSVEPQQMLHAVVSTQRTTFLKRKSAALRHHGPVPGHIEKHLALLIMKARPYQQSVRFIDGTNYMEATVVSQRDPTHLRHVRLTAEPQTPPMCCSHSSSGDGFPCYHGVAVLCEKHGSVNLHKFIAVRHLRAAWKAQYEDVDFPFPAQSDVDNIRLDAKRLVAQNLNIRIPVALPPPRGRPVKNAGTRKRSWYEKGPHPQNKRSYSCSLCHRPGHVATKCELRQMFDNDGTNPPSQ